MSNANHTAPGGPRLRLPRPLVPIVFAWLISGLVSWIVTGVVTLVHTGLDAGYPLRWLHVWVLAWTTAFPLVAFFGPRVKRFVDRFGA